MNDENTIKDLHLHEDEEAIQKTIHYLELHDPDNANREYAVGFLKFMSRVRARGLILRGFWKNIRSLQILNAQ